MPRKKVVQFRDRHARFCAYLRDLREENGYTQEKVGAAMKLSRSQYTALESGRSMLTFDQLYALADFYRVKLSILIQAYEL